MSNRRQRGIALIAVLWVLLLLAFLAASFSSSTRTEANLARNLVENAKAEALADAGVYRAIAGLAIPIEEGGVRVDGTPYAWAFADGEVRFAIHDEGGKIDLNGAPVGLLHGLLRSVGLDEEETTTIADAIADFRDEDDERRPSGAEDPDYRAAGLPHGAKDAPFEMVDELLRVEGMTGELFVRLRPSLTVYTGEDLPDRSTASPEVLAALAAVDPEDLEQDLEQDMAEEEADEALRREEDQADTPSSPLTSSLSTLEEGGSDARSQLGVYSVHSEGRSAGGAVYSRDVVVRVNEGSDPPYLFLAWGQGRRELFPVGAPPDE
jgi:general secretion pathway protein K